MAASVIHDEGRAAPGDGEPVRQFPGKYLSVTTFRRDGTPVATPVWFVQEGARLLIETDAASGKVKRLRRDPKVLVAPCGASGKLRGGQVSAHAELLGPEEMARVHGLLAAKYRIDRVFIVPLFRLMQAITHKRGSNEEPVIVAITPSGARADG